jgi:hypothetical protein
MIDGREEEDLVDDDCGSGIYPMNKMRCDAMWRRYNQGERAPSLVERNQLAARQGAKPQE